MILIKNIKNPFNNKEYDSLKVNYKVEDSLSGYLKRSGFNYHDRRVIVSGKVVKPLQYDFHVINEYDEIIIAPNIKIAPASIFQSPGAVAGGAGASSLLGLNPITFFGSAFNMVYGGIQAGKKRRKARRKYEKAYAGAGLQPWEGSAEQRAFEKENEWFDGYAIDLAFKEERAKKEFEQNQINNAIERQVIEQQSSVEDNYPIFDSSSESSSGSFGLDSNYGHFGSLEASSPTYGWDGIRTQQIPGVAIGIIYGTHKVSGNIINQWVYNDGEKNYLNVLLAICEGEISGISDIKINENPISNYSGITQVTRLGTNNQTVIPNFEDLHNVYPINALLDLNGGVYNYTTVDFDVDAFECNFLWPYGLYETNPRTGGLSGAGTTIKIGYRLTSAGGAYTESTHSFENRSRSPQRRNVRITGLTADQYDIQITNLTVDLDNHISTVYLTSVDEVKTDDLVYPNVALLGLQFLANEQISGSVPNITLIADGKLISAPKVLNGAATVEWADYYWNDDNSEFRLLSDDTSLTWDGTTYIDQHCKNPMWCLMDLMLNNRYGSGDFLSTDERNLPLAVEMAKYCEEKVPDGSGGFEKRFILDVVIDSQTRAMDLFVQLATTFRAFPFYSNGTVNFRCDKEETPSQMFGMGNIIENSFSTSWKSVKNSPNVFDITFSDQDKDYKQEIIQFENQTSIITNGDARRTRQMRVFTTRISQAIREGRYAKLVAQHINRTVSFKVSIDSVMCQAGDVINVCHDVPQWGFSGRVTEKFVIIIGFNDKIDWTEDTVTYSATLTPTQFTPTGLASHLQAIMRAQGDSNTNVVWDGGGTNKITIANSTLTTFTLPWSTGANTAQTCGKSLGFDITADDTGALSYLADNAIVSANTTTKVKLDTKVDIVSGTYKLRVKDSGDDTQDEQTVSDGAGTYTELNLSSPLSFTPSEYDVYAFGLQNILVKPFRVVSISRANNHEAKIECMEYSTNVYDETAVTIPTTNYSVLSSELQNVTNLKLSERIQKNKDGTIETVIEVGYQIPDLADYYVNRVKNYKIYISDDSGLTYQLRGETTTDHFEIITGIKDLNTYIVVVVPVSENGEQKPIGDSVSDSIYVLGKSAPPDDVTGFVAIQDGSGVRFSWGANPDVDLYGYEIREGATWDDGSIVATEILGTDYFLQIPAFGTKTYLIKAIDTSYNFSNIAASFSVTVDNTPNIDNLQEDDLDTWSEGSFEAGSEIANVVDSSSDNVVDSGSNQVVVSLVGFEIKTEVADSFVVDSLGNTVVDSGNNPLIVSQTLSDFLELRNLEDGTYALEGVYISKVIDLSKKYRTRINVISNVEGIDNYYSIQIRTSDDASTWSAWTVWGFGEYECRYYQIKFILGTNDNSKVARLKYLKSRATLIYYDELFQDETYDGVTPTTVTFAHTYFDRIGINIQEQGNYYAEVTAKTFNPGGTSSVTFRLRDASTDALTSGTADVIIKGY